MYMVSEVLFFFSGSKMSNEHRRALYPELIKRLDDSNNKVRMAACGSLRAFVQTLAPDYCDTNTSYFAAPILIHMDDSDSEIQQSVCDVVMLLASKKPRIVVSEVNKVRDRFRCKTFCDRVLAAAKENEAGHENVGYGVVFAGN